MGLGRKLGQGIRWFESRLLVELLVAGFGVLLAWGEISTWDWTALLATCVLSVLLASRFVRVARSYDPDKAQPVGGPETFQLQLILLCAVFLLLQFTGSVASPLYPVLFLLLAAIGGFEASLVKRVAITTIAMCFELISFFVMARAPTHDLIVHLAAITGFPFLVGALEWAWTAAERKKWHAEIAKRLKKADDEAKEYRLSGMMTSQSREIAPEKRAKDLQRSSVRHLGIGVHNVLEILDAALLPHTVAIYWLSVDEKSVTLMDALSRSDVPLRKTLEAGEGVIGAILKGRNPICRNHLSRSDRLFNYYKDPVRLKSFIGVPMLEGPPDGSEGPWHKRGVLIADKLVEHVDVPFSPEEEKLLEIACREIIRIWRTERHLNRLDLIRHEAQGLYVATEGLIESVTLQEVVDETAESLRRIYKGADFATVVLQDAEGGSLVIKSVNASERFEAWKKENLNREVARGNHLCALAMRKSMIVPDSAFDKRSRSQRRIFGARQEPAGLKSVKVAPLKLASTDEDNVGVLVIGGTSGALFHDRGGRADDVKRTLDTFSNIAAISIQNAKRYEQLEELATTDSLTGLHNRRRFFEMMDEAVAEAQRYQRPLSLIMTDIDRFKSVNDTYGHPMGDEVLKRVARVLTEMARTTDRVCRVGGEEFTIIMPETDHPGGLMLAERFRQEIKKQEFQYDGKRFAISLSLGICTLPGFARHLQELFHRADQALYHAKNNGRDRTVHFADIPSPPAAEKAHEEEFHP